MSKVPHYNHKIKEMAAVKMIAATLPIWNREEFISTERKRIEEKYAAKKVSVQVTPISGTHSAIEWRICPHKDLPDPSAAERLIIDELNLYNIEWYREVEFIRHKKTEYSHYRYDFWIPSIRLVIEYDGKKSHMTREQIENDAEKDRFCQNNNISIVRLNSKHYYKMWDVIDQILSRYNIKRKPTK